MISLSPGTVTDIAVLGAHCDDIAIAMGGTLRSLTPGVRVRALVLTGGGTTREAEEHAALEAFCPDADLELTVLDFPDGRTPAHWNAVKDAVRDFRKTCEPQLVFAPHRHDAHQDHRLLAELVPTEFRDHLILGYEILKWETDTPRPTVFHALSSEAAHEKARLLHKCYPSQEHHDWFEEESFLGLARLRGVQCRAPYAEAFMLDKAVLTLGKGQ